MTATHLAAWKGHLTILEYLLNSGANVNIGDIGGQTALHTAAEAGQEAACRALRQFGADVSVRDSQARSAADLARASNLPRLAEELKPPAVLRVGQLLICLRLYCLALLPYCCAAFAGPRL